MKKFYTILGYVIAALVCLLIWNSRNTKDKYEEEVEGYESKIEELQVSIDSLYEVNDSLEIKMDSLVIEVELSEERIVELNSNLDEIKIKNKQIADNVNSFTDDELQKFFTERYGYLKDTIN
jgi:chromosome segregation ATPase